MKKSVLILGFLGLLISSIFLSGGVYAANAGMSGVITGIGDIITFIYDTAVQPLAKFLIGPESAGEPGKFFTLILFLVLLVSLLWEITERVPFIGNNSWVQFIVSFGVALISIRFLGETANAAWFETILLPNQALGITLLCLIPFVIYFFFVMDVGAGRPTLAKILWIFAAVLFAVLYFVRMSEVGELNVSLGKGFNPLHIYLIAAVASVVFLFFDGTIRKWLHNIKLEKAEYAGRGGAKLAIQERIQKVTDQYSSQLGGYRSVYSTKTGHAGYLADIKELNKALKNLG